MDAGKRFEANFEEACKALEAETKLGVVRLYDPVGGFKGVANICDYIVGRYPYTFYFELKARNGDRINFKEALTETQYDGMVAKSRVKGSIAGPIFKYREHNEAYFVDIRYIEKMKADGHKSITLEQAKALGVYLGGKFKRTNWDYDVMPFLDNIERGYHFD